MPETKTPTTAITVDVPQSLDELQKIDWLGHLQSAGLKLAGGLLILLIGLWLARRLANWLDRALTRASMEATLRGFLRNISYGAMVVVVTTSALFAIGVSPASVLAVLGAAGLAIGLALKDSLSNIASGVMLIVQRPFRVGDFVEIGGMMGTVEQIRVFQTRINGIDNRGVVLPNSLITTAPIINFTANPRRRVDVAVGVGYEDDLKLARETLLEVARQHPKVLDQPAPEVHVTGLADSSVNMELRAWANTPDFGVVRSEITEAVRNAIIGRGLNIPYPQRDLHVYHHDAKGAPLGELLMRSVADDGDLPAVKP